MRGFRFLPAFLIVFSAMPASAAETKFCHQIKPAQTTVNIELELPKPYYDLTKSIREINEDRSGFDDWLKKNGMQQVWRSENMARLGYAEGGAAMISSASFMAKKYDMYGVYYCPFITHIDVAMIFRTRIVIPKEFKNGGCRFNHIREHELRHYQANGEVAIEFVEQLKKDLPQIIAETERRQPYVLGADVQQRFEALKIAVKDAIEVYVVESMRAEMKRRNGRIDTPEEYASSGPKMKACKD